MSQPTLPENWRDYYGPDSNPPQVPRATNGGQLTAKPINYHEPQGPTSINSPQRPGLHGTNHGNSGSQHRG